MGLVPTPRLIVVLAALLLPCAAVLAYSPASGAVIALVVLLIAILIFVDAIRALNVLDSVRVSVPEVVRGTLGEKCDIDVTIEQPIAKARLVYVGLALPVSVASAHEAQLVRLPADAVRALTSWECTPGERGNYPLRRVHLGAASPWGLWEHRRAVPIDGVLRVYPNVQGARKSLAALFLDRSAFGVHARRHIGKGREFEHLREYAPGDSFEDIHWKATARRGGPVTKMYQVERTQEVYVAIDSSRLSGANHGGETSTIESFINAALVMALVAEKQGDLFGLLSFDRQVGRFIKARTGREHFNVCRDAIHALQPSEENPDFGDLFSFIRLRLRKRVLLVVLTDLSDPLLAEEFCRHVDLVSRNHLVLVNCIADPQVVPAFAAGPVASADEIYGRLAGHVEWSDLQRVRRALQVRNVGLQFVEHGALAAAVISQYMNQKQRQLL